MSMKNNLYSLIELLVTIGVIAILAALLLPALGNAKMVAQRIACSSNLKQIGQGFMYYIQDYNEWTPPRYPYWPDYTQVWENVINTYVPPGNAWKCPVNTCPDIYHFYVYNISDDDPATGTRHPRKYNTISNISAVMILAEPGIGFTGGDAFSSWTNINTLGFVVHNSYMNACFLDWHVGDIKKSEIFDQSVRIRY